MRGVGVGAGVPAVLAVLAVMREKFQVGGHKPMITRSDEEKLYGCWKSGVVQIFSFRYFLTNLM